MRTILNMGLVWGLVDIPVGLAPAARSHSQGLRSLHRECGTPIRQQRFCPLHDRLVEQEELVRGYEFAKGQYVLLEENELAELDTRLVVIDRLVPADRVPWLLRDRTYWLAPELEPRALAAYALLEQTLRERGQAGVGQACLFGSDLNTVVEAVPHPSRLTGNGLLALTTLHDQLVEPDDGDMVWAAAEQLPATAVKQAGRLAAAMSTRTLQLTRPASRRQDLIEAKLAGREIIVPEPASAGVAPPVDLAETLKASVTSLRARKNQTAAGPLQMTLDRPAAAAR